jgi:RNA polymerase sigma factor (sigma-70 family)
MLWIKRKTHFSSATEKSDAELIQEFKSGKNAQALGVLFERYVHLVFGVCMKYLKDKEESRDATMQIFEKLRTDLQKHEVQKFSYWLHTVSKNYCLMQLRSRDAMKNYDDALLVTEDGVTEDGLLPGLFEENNSEQFLEILPAAIQNLNEEQRACIELFYMKEKCYEEVSEITGYTMKQVKSYIQNGKRNLKIYLVKHVRQNEKFN